MGDVGINLEALNSALKSIRILRSSVVEVFKFLDDGAAAAHDEGEREKFVNEAQQKLTSVRSRMRDLETACTLLGSPNVPLNLGNSGLLSQDPAYEKTSLYNDVVKSYQWFDKLHEHSSHACAILTQNSLKRTNNRPLSPNSMQTSRPQPTGHNVPAQNVDAVISQFNHVFPDMPIQIVRPCGASTILLITLGRTLKALVILRGLIIEWVVVKGYDEDFNDRNEEAGIIRNFTFPHDNQGEQFRPFEARQFVSVNTGSKLDMWSQSRYKVFQKVTDNANAAMLHFYSPHLPDLAVRSFLTWLRSYSNLFTATCRKCNVRLLDNMPPTWRDVRNLDVYHEACKP